jgi:hypothetical protein
MHRLTFFEEHYLQILFYESSLKKCKALLQRFIVVAKISADNRKKFYLAR